MEKTRMDYVPPRMDVYRTEASQILAGTTEFSGTHQDGEADYNTSGSAGQGSLTTVTGAKILGREFEFSDVWEE